MFNHPGRLRHAAALLIAALAPVAHATVIGFESPDLTGIYLPGDTFAESGYTLTTRLDYGVIDTAASLGALAPTGDATQFYFNSNQGALAIASTSGAFFSLSSFAAAFVSQDVPSTQKTVIVAVGTTSTNATVTAYWSFATGTGSNNPFATYASAADFVAFGSLKSVEFHACSIVGTTICSQALSNNGQFAIDNITVTSVPEPASLALMGLGLVGVGGIAARARRGRG